MVSAMNAGKKISQNVKHIDIISYDFDGTLVDSIPDITAAMNHTLREYNLPPVTAVQMKSFVGDGIPLMVERALTAALNVHKNQNLFNGYYDSVLKRYKLLYSEHCTEKSRLYPGVPEVLRHFSHKIQILITNKAESMTRKMLRHFELEEYFDLIIGGDTLPERKPHPSIMEYVRSKYGMNLTLCHVGDSTVDIKTAKEAKALSVAVSYGYSSDDALKNARPDYVINHFQELINVIV